MNESENVPPPGSEEALKIGCKCPVLDNVNGKGYMHCADLYVFSLECPLHCPKEKSK